tara:strand:- start:1880 stop:2548 length:669 start_codon:yes stop_codon:yes gene_type:complete
MASRYSSAASGAATGASIGSTFAPGIGTAIGAGLGAIGGAAFGGPSETEQTRLKRLQELQRRQELGTLGFTDEEINVRLGAAQGQTQQQMQADRQEQASLLGAQDLGAGSFAKGQQAQAQREQTVMAQLANQVQQDNIQKAAQQEAELAGLQTSQLNQEEYERQQLLASGASIAGTLGTDRDTADRQEAADELIESMNQLDLTVAERDDLSKLLEENMGAFR